LAENIQRVQTVQGIAPNGFAGRHFYVEMETGTGKTYVYLRTIYELHERFGFTKFIVVVPSVAIREGVMKTIELTRDHFRELHGNKPADSWIYNSRQVSRLRQRVGRKSAAPSAARLCSRSPACKSGTLPAQPLGYSPTST